MRGRSVSEGSFALDAWFPAETRRQADASRSPLSRPSIDLPPTDYNPGVEHVCENLWRGVLRTRTETVPERAPTGTTPGGGGMDTVHLRDGSAPVRSQRTPHLPLQRLRGGDRHSAPYGTSVLRGAVAAETDAGATAARLGR